MQFKPILNQHFNQNIEHCYHPKSPMFSFPISTPPQAHHYSNVYLEKLVLFVLEHRVNGITHIYC